MSGVRSGNRGSRSENGSVAGSRVGGSRASQRSSGSAYSYFEPKAVEKRQTGHLDNAVLLALKGGGTVSACLRGGPLCFRACQACKDVAENCSLGMQCPFLAKRIDAMLLKQFPKDAPETEMAEAVFRFVQETAAQDDLRAKQVMATSLKATEQRCLFPVRAHKQVIAKLDFVQQQIQASKSATQVEAEVPVFLKGIKASDEKADCANLLELWKIMEDFGPFLIKARDEEAAKENKKKSMHGNSEVVEKFLNTKRYKGDRAFMAALLEMSCHE